MILRFFDLSAVNEFAQSVTDDYLRIRKSGVARGENARKQAQRMEKLAGKIDAFCKEKQLNFYKKAHLLNTIRKQLLGVGASEPDVTAFLSSSIAKSLPDR